MTRDNAGKWHGVWHEIGVYFVNIIDIIPRRLKFKKGKVPDD